MNATNPFIKFQSHGNVNPAFIKRWAFHQQQGVLTLHIHGEGEVNFSGQEALDGKAQLEALEKTGVVGTAIQTEKTGKAGS
jgi:hypothetical protein